MNPNTEQTMDATLNTDEIYHATRIAFVGGAIEAYGHNSTTCDPIGCAGYERFLGAFSARDVDFGGDTYFVVTSSIVMVNLDDEQVRRIDERFPELVSGPRKA